MKYPSFYLYLGKWVGWICVIICILVLFCFVRYNFNWGKITKWGVILICFGIISIYSTMQISKYNNWANQNGISSSSDKDINAWVCAKDYVTNNLKSPSTAKFCSYTDSIVNSLGSDKFSVTGYVDSENGFGATIRVNFTVTLTLTGSGYKDASMTTY